MIRIEANSGGETILITGSSGFVGSWLVELLHLGGHPSVRAGIRGWSNAARLGRTSADIVFCDVMKPDQIDAAVAGATHVIHCAIGPRDVIVEGTRNMLEASVKHRVKPVSYTHLRAHETDSYLVCRLLLEKKKNK